MTMGIGLMILLSGLIVFFFVLMFIVSAYNGLVSMRDRYRDAYARIDVQLKRRDDLIPDLVEMAKDYLKHERGTLEVVIAARNAASLAGGKAAANPGDPAAMRELSSAETALADALERLFALSGAYPDLKANTTRMGLIEEQTSIKNKITFARQAYNDLVRAYNTRREVFPSNIIAGTFNLGPAGLFVVDQPQQEVPTF